MVAVSVEYLIFRFFFDRDLSLGATTDGQPDRPALPVFAVVVAGFGLAALTVAPVLAASVLALWLSLRVFGR